METLNRGVRGDNVGFKSVIVPGAPLEDNISLAIQLLNNRAGYTRSGMPTRHDLAQIQFAEIIPKLKRVSIGQTFEIVTVSDVAIAAGNRFNQVRFEQHRLSTEIEIKQPNAFEDQFVESVGVTVGV